MQDEIKALLDWFQRPNWNSAITKSAPHLAEHLKAITNFLPTDYPLSIRAWHLINAVYHIPICKKCDKEVYYRKRVRQYSDYCYLHLKETEQKNREKANIQKYGNKTTLCVKPFIEKGKKTKKQRYGVENVSQSVEVRQKIKSTLKDKYGVDNPSQIDSVKEKKAKSAIDSFGVDCVLKSPDIKKKISRTNLQKYGYENPIKSTIVKEKIKETCKEKYNRDFHSQKHISEENFSILNSKEKLIELHEIQKKSQGEIAKELGVAQTTISDYFILHGIETKYFYSSSGERELFAFIQNIFPDAEHNNRSAIGTELDCFIPSIKLAIEFNGIYWHSEKYKDRFYHYNKMKKCNDNGIKLINIYETEWEENKELIKLKLLHIFNKSPTNKIYARKTKIVHADKETKAHFFNAYHIQGNGPSSLNFGLRDEQGHLVACMGFIQNKNNELILNRYATSKTVVGGFTKLLNYVERLFSNPKIITFADLRWSDGTLYEKAGFTLDKKLKPDYQWVVGNKLYHKFNWRHSAKLKKLKNYDPNKSEMENMHLHGFFRIWDCGKLRFIKNGT